jgi:toluene monooxygenase system protein E
MTETAAQPKRRRTWSLLGDIRRVPTEYEIVTHAANYTARQGRSAALEANTSSPHNLWFLTYRDKSPLQSDDWDGFRDPDEMTYRKYVTVQDDSETVVQALLDEYDESGQTALLDPGWVETLGTVFTPTRYPCHAMQMGHLYLGHIAPAGYIQYAACFAGADMLRRVTLVAYRARELQLAHPGGGFVDNDRSRWEKCAGWQGVRKLLEQMLVAYDWGEAFTALNLVIRPTLDDILLRQFGELGRQNGDTLTWLLSQNLDDDAARCRRWSAALARYAVQSRPENASVLNRWVERWAPRADEAAAGLAGLFETMPPHGRPAVDVIAEARTARHALLTEASLLEA